MKNITKLFALLLALAMVLAMGTAAFAESGTNDNSGSITIDNAVTGQTYTVYQILVLESYNTATGAYVYKAAEAWDRFINGTDIKGVYVEVDDQGYVTWKSGADAAAFAKLAQAYAKGNTIANQGTEIAASESVSFTGLNLGYYLLDSTLGTLCSLTTTAPSVTVKEKNEAPTNVKTVLEDSDSTYGNVNDAEIGQTVSYKSTVTLPKGSENVVFHDTMTEDLTLNADSIKVYTDSTLSSELSADNYTLKTEGLDDGCAFEISFTGTYLDGLTSTATLYIGYSATLNDKAVAGGEAVNNSYLHYGETATSVTPRSTAKTYTWKFDILKYGNGNTENVLSDAKFVLLNSDKSKVAVIADGKLTGWVNLPAENEDWSAGSIMTTNAAGKIEIAGVDAETYYLREIDAPRGYNILSEDIECKVERSDASNETTLAQKELTVKINNQSGTVLPTTGGIGTTIFYVLGGLLTVSALVFFVVKKRMGTEN